MMSLKNVNQITHFTDWTIAHTHIAGMAWNGGIVFGMLYWLVPKTIQDKIIFGKTGKCPLLDRHPVHSCVCHPALLVGRYPVVNAEGIYT